MPGSPTGSGVQGSPQGSAADLDLDKIFTEAGWPANPLIRGAGAAIVKRESNGDAHACCGKRCTTPQQGACAKQTSTDRGLFQINDRAHPDVTDACAYDPVCNAKAALRISQGGKNWAAWRSSGGTPSPIDPTSIKVTGQDKPGNPLDAAVNAVKAPLDAVGGIATALEKLVEGLFSSALWFRVGKILVGLFLGATGIILIARKAGVSLPPVIPV